MARTATLTKAEEVAAAQAKLTEEREKVAQRQTVVDAAKEFLEELETRLTTKADDSVSTADLVSARAAVDRAEMLASGQEKIVRQLERSLPFEPELAEALHIPLSAILDLDVQVVDKAPEKRPDTLPAAYLVQKSAHRTDVVQGSLSGRVELVWIAGPHHRALDEDQTEGDLRALQQGVTVSRGTVKDLDSNGTTIQKLAIEASAARSWYPVIAADPQDWQVARIAGGLANDVCETTWYGGKIREVVEGKLLRQESKTQDGLRTTTVTIDLGFSTSVFKAPEMLAKVERAVKGRVDRFVQFVGRIESAEVTGKAHDGARATFTIVSSTTA